MKTSRPSGFVMAAAIVGILGSVFGLLFALLGMAGVMMMPREGAPGVPENIRTLALIGLLLFVGVGVFGLVTSIQVLRLKNWARIAMIIWGALLAFFCGIVCVAMLFVPLPESASSSPIGHYAIRMILVTVYGLPGLVGVWWLVLFNQASVKQQFEGIGEAEGRDQSRRVAKCPLPLAIIAGFFVFSVVFTGLLYPLMHLPANVLSFGYRIGGKPGVAILALTLGLMLVSSIGILRLKNWSHPLLLGLCFFWLASGTGNVLSPNYEKNVKEMVSQMNLPVEPTASAAYTQTRTFAILSLLPSLVVIWLLLYYQTKFVEACAAKAAQRSAADVTQVTPGC